MGQPLSVEATVANVPALVTLLTDVGSSQRKKAAAALAALSISYANRLAIKREAVAALAKLSVAAEMRALIAASGAIPPLLNFIRGPSSSAKATAAEILVNLTTTVIDEGEIVAYDEVPSLVKVDTKELREKPENHPLLPSQATIIDLAQADTEEKTSLVPDNITRAGAIPLLAAFLRDGTVSQQQKALEILSYLSTSSRLANTRSAMIAGGAIPPLLVLLRDGDDSMKLAAALVLGYLAASPDKLVIMVAGGIPPLVALLRDGNADQKRNAAVALSVLSSEYENRAAIAEAGGIPPLVAILCQGRDNKETATTALMNLAVVL
ncbi:hypothetical protein PHYPSEUDO_011740 [Phytophthora pseudosyringae]|uniref:Uncharacterized protein n=1 Tax=Phytophthora pseudosyringae TaxID=221518 RepID=A0A8T1V8N5_9STRA|nr:hypothetical protein PHYPSEUDO_011740 [Phytophthora pseudosyringae]